MSFDTEQDVNPESSAGAEEIDVTNGAQDLPPDGEADSSSAEDVAVDTLSIVKDVVGAEAETGSSPDSSEDTEAEGTTEGSGDEGGGYENLPFGKHPRFQEVLGKVKAAEAKVAELEPAAQSYRNVERFLADSSMSPDEAASGLQIMALAKSNPVEAWNQIKPWVQELATAAGVIVPQNLQQRVQAGELAPETARELAAAQARATAADQQRQMDVERQQRQQQESARQALVQSVESWETERRLRDPNFAAKYDALQREVAFMQAREGRPNDVTGARDQLERAYTAVNAAYRPAEAAPAPAKKAIKPVTGGQSAGSPKAELTSTMDIINDVMAKG